MSFKTTEVGFTFFPSSCPPFARGVKMSVCEGGVQQTELVHPFVLAAHIP